MFVCFPFVRFAKITPCSSLLCLCVGGFGLTFLKSYEHFSFVRAKTVPFVAMEISTASRTTGQARERGVSFQVHEEPKTKKKKHGGEVQEFSLTDFLSSK